MIIYCQRYSSPCGELLLGQAEGKLCFCDWADAGPSRAHRQVIKRLRAEVIEQETALLTETARQLDEYFCGDRREFNLPLMPEGTDFQKQVWSALEKIPYGQTLSYSKLAARIGRPRAVRAVAAAVGANPLSILLPCHRVIGADGSLTGYAGGLQAKTCLLSLEKRFLF